MFQLSNPSYRHHYHQGRIQRGGLRVRTPLELWQKSGYQIRDWDRFDIAQHLCKLVINLKRVQNVETSWLELETLTFLVYGLHPLKSGNQKYHIIRRVRFRWDTPPPPPPPRESYLDPRMTTLLLTNLFIFKFEIYSTFSSVGKLAWKSVGKPNLCEPAHWRTN